jgi:hypothetical protein
MSLPSLPGRTFERLRRCQNCAYFRSGPEVTADICREKNFLNPLEPRLVVTPSGTLNPGITDQLLLQVARGRAGRCGIGASGTDITSGDHLCEQWRAGISGLESGGKVEDITVDEFRAKHGL